MGFNKLSDTSVAQIHRRLADGEPIRSIADSFGVTKEAIYYVRDHRKVRPLPEFSDEDCWLWWGATDGMGYGVIHPAGREGPQWKVHRLSWALEHGEEPPSGHAYEVHHECGRKICFNPRHLSLVKNAGHKREHSQFTQGDIDDIRRRYLSGEEQKEIGKSYGLRQADISRIVRNKTWYDPEYQPIGDGRKRRWEKERI